VPQAHDLPRTPEADCKQCFWYASALSGSHVVGVASRSLHFYRFGVFAPDGSMTSILAHTPSFAVRLNHASTTNPSCDECMRCLKVSSALGAMAIFTVPLVHRPCSNQGTCGHKPVPLQFSSHSPTSEVVRITFLATLAPARQPSDCARNRCLQRHLAQSGILAFVVLGPLHPVAHVRSGDSRPPCIVTCGLSMTTPTTMIPFCMYSRIRSKTALSAIRLASLSIRIS